MLILYNYNEKLFKKYFKFAGLFVSQSLLTRKEKLVFNAHYKLLLSSTVQYISASLFTVHQLSVRFKDT